MNLFRSRYLLWLPVAALVTLPAAAQNPGSAAPAAGRVSAVVLHINDLGLLRALVPLKLKPDQIDRLVTALREVETARKVRAAEEENAVLALAEEVAAARKAALAGTPVPPELEKRVADAGKASDARLKKARSEAAARVLTVTRQALTAEQLEEIAAQSRKALGGTLVPREYRQNPNQAPPEVVQNLAIASFIENVLFNERAIQVLTEMKAAQPAETTAPAP